MDKKDFNLDGLNIADIIEAKKTQINAATEQPELYELPEPNDKILNALITMLNNQQNLIQKLIKIIVDNQADTPQDTANTDYQQLITALTPLISQLKEGE